MRASVLRGAHEVTVDERPPPRPGPSEVLVLTLTGTFRYANPWRTATGLVASLLAGRRDEHAVK